MALSCRMSGLGPEDAADISLAVLDVVVVVGPVARAVDGGAAEKKARHARKIPVLMYSRPPARYRCHEASGQGSAGRPHHRPPRLRATALQQQKVIAGTLSLESYPHARIGCTNMNTEIGGNRSIDVELEGAGFLNR